MAIIVTNVFGKKYFHEEIFFEQFYLSSHSECKVKLINNIFLLIFTKGASNSRAHCIFLNGRQCGMLLV